MKINIFYGTVYGAAEYSAEQIADAINSETEHEAEVIADPNVAAFVDAEAVLFVSSTTGQGDIPDNLVEFFHQLKDGMPLMDGKPFFVIALGDSSYGETYCGAGVQIHELLEELQGTAKKELLKIDGIEVVNADEVAVPAAVEWANSL